jgi:hypothetical protein
VCIHCQVSYSTINIYYVCTQPVQHWRDSVEVGDMVETKRFGKSGYILAKVEHIKVASKEDLNNARIAAHARAQVPSNNLRTFKGLMYDDMLLCVLVCVCACVCSYESFI